ncbi:hypothetical protein [Halomonas sp. M4R1S46]|uniref:hypothetical protein n=1 Tax=Halomonas sp. M4R1S46 TaxID=2982692 RepID=UPI0021E3ED38|nr:hypothetical protein [Halomonas sp. M4R1S46]UYG06025.1 hypothetical protein OCT48_10195 [Halomonas sp. M4R1S46]
MLSTVISSLRWNGSLGAKFFRVVPLPTLLIVLLTLVSQIATLLASFLPLKVVILLGSESVPRYFPASFAKLDHDVLVVLLSLSTVGFFLLYLAVERLIAWTTGKSAQRLLAKSHKMVLFENQDELAASSYHRYSRALASGVFIALAMLGLAWFYPYMALVMAGYAAIVLLVLGGIHAISPAFRERLELRLVPTLNLVGGVGFFVAFGYLVADFIFWNPPGVIIAIVSLLLSRQLMNRATGMIGDLSSLRRQRAKLDALFFHGKVLLPQNARPEKTLWPLLQPHARLEWVRLVLDELVATASEPPVCYWRQSGVPNVAGLDVQYGGKRYLVKLFDANRSSLALHEATLMGESLKDLPAPAWVGTTQVQKFHCLVYELPEGGAPEPREVKSLVEKMRTEMMAISPSPGILHRYQRSRPMLWQRLDASVLERLSIAVSSSKQQRDLESLLDHLPRLYSVLQSLPVVLFNPELNQDTIWVPARGTRPLMLSWGRWSLEPLGAGWPERPELLECLPEALLDAANLRSSLAKVAPAHAQLASLTFALERECNKQRYVQALELLPPILERLETINEPEHRQGAMYGGWV